MPRPLDSKVEAELPNLAFQLGITSEMGLAALRVAINNLITFERKQRDYGSGNIAAFGEFGVLVRVNDKVERLKTLHKRALADHSDTPHNESVADSWLDLANYGLIGYLCHEGDWR